MLLVIQSTKQFEIGSRYCSKIEKCITSMSAAISGVRRELLVCTPAQKKNFIEASRVKQNFSTMNFQLSRFALLSWQERLRALSRLLQDPPEPGLLRFRSARRRALAPLGPVADFAPARSLPGAPRGRSSRTQAQGGRKREGRGREGC